MIEEVEYYDKINLSVPQMASVEEHYLHSSFADSHLRQQILFQMFEIDDSLVDSFHT